MADANILITGDESQFLKSLEKVHEAETRIENKMVDVGEAGQQAGEAAGQAMERAGKRGSSEFDKLLRELRKTGPEGRKQAAEIEKHLQETGKQGRQSVGTIVDKLGEIDPEVAKIARNAQEKFDKVGKAGDQAFGSEALTKLTAFVGGWVSVGSAVQLVNQYTEEQIRLTEQARDAQLSLAVAQSDAAKNLIGLGELERSELLQEAVPAIAAETGFSDLSALTTAIGSARSAGGTEEQVVSAVRAAASLTQLTPQSIDEFAGAGIDLARATGLDDAEQNLGLLLTTGTQSRVVDPLSLAKELAPAVNNAVAQTTGQDRVEASREAAALFATFTQQSTDVTGAPSRTATIQFSSEIGKFFQGLEDEQIKARSRISQLDKKDDMTEAETAERQRLQRFLDDSAGMQDAGSLFGRIQTLQQSEGVREQFFSREFGEASFKTAFKQLGDATSETSKMMIAAKDAIKTDAEVFRAEVQSEATLTPQLRLGMLDARSQANLAVGEQGRTEAAKLAEVRSIVKDTLDTAPSSGMFEYLLTDLPERALNAPILGGMRGGTAVEEAVTGIERIQSRMVALQFNGLQGDEQATFTALQRQVGLLQEFVQSEAQSGLPSGIRQTLIDRSRQAAGQNLIDARSQDLQQPQAMQYAQNAEVFNAMIQKLEAIATATQATAQAANSTAGNTSPANRPPNYSAGLQAGAAGAAAP